MMNYIGGKTFIWPHFMRVFEFTHPNYANPIFEGFKSLAFLHFCNRDEKIKKCFEYFLQKTASVKIEDYVGRIMHLAKINFTGQPYDHLNNNNLFTAKNADPLLDSITLSSSDILGYKDKQKDFLGIKEKPIFKYDDEKNVVLSWNYLVSFMYFQ